MSRHGSGRRPDRVPFPEPYAEEQGDLFDPDAFADRLLDEDWAAERSASSTMRVATSPRSMAASTDQRARAQADSAQRPDRPPGATHGTGARRPWIVRPLLRVVRRELDAIVRDVLSRDADNRKN